MEKIDKGEEKKHTVEITSNQENKALILQVWCEPSKNFEKVQIYTTEWPTRAIHHLLLVLVAAKY